MAAYAFDTEREEYWAHITTGTHVAQICLFLLVEARFIPGVLLQTAPPRGRQAQGMGSYELIDLDLSRYDAINARLAVAHQDAVSFLKSGIATRNPRFNTMIEEIERIAVQSKAPILLTGPTGAGKSMLARRIFELKKSRHQITGGFVDVNCATLHGDGAASTLFGHKKGSFTGAASDRPGLLRTADKGVLFLDEIGELGLDEQAMLLKAVEEKRFLPVGADKEVESSFQLIAGTNRDLRTEVALGRFREDLFARINLWTYTLPGLSQRREDIEPNIEHQLQLASEDLGRKTRMTTEARAAYLRFAQSAEAVWTGNFRDLSASITRLATLGDNGRIGAGLVEAEIARLRWQWQSTDQDAGAAGAAAVPMEELLGGATDTLDYFDRLQLQAVIAVCRKHNSLSDAGRELFNVSRAQRSVVNDADRLRKYLMKFDLSWDKVKA
jgi:transcriptional regulatory protein RtcR